MQGKCERRGGNINADTANAEVFVGDGCSQGASFGPMALISRRGQGGRIYNNTRTRERLRRKCVKPADHTTFPAEDLLPPPHSDAPFPSTFSLPSRALSLLHAAPTHARQPHNTFPAEDLRSPRTATRPARAFSHPLPEHFRSPTQPRRTPAGCAMHSSPTSQTHSPPKTFARPAQRHARPEHFLTPFPSTSAPPRSPDAHPQAARCILRRRPSHAPAQRRALPEHFLTPSPRRHTPAGCTMHSPPTSQHISRRRSAPTPAQRHALPEHFRSPTQPRRTPAGCAMHARRPHNTFLVEDLLPSPSVPLRAQKNGTAQWMCDAECLGRPSLRSVIGVGEPRAVRRRCGALAWRVGLRPQPWALRSRRCGRVLRA